MRTSIPIDFSQLQMPSLTKKKHYGVYEIEISKTSQKVGLFSDILSPFLGIVLSTVR